MIRVYFCLMNPFVRYGAKTIWQVMFLRGHKCTEVVVEKENGYLAGFLFGLRAREDHAGVDFKIGLFGWTFNIHFYDTRHWNDEEGRYYK